MGLLSMRIDDDLEQRLAREADREQRTRSEIVREALTSFLMDRERQRYIDQIARAARELDPGAAQAVAEEALPFDNEALHAAEPRAAYRTGRKGKGRKR